MSPSPPWQNANRIKSFLSDQAEGNLSTMDEKGALRMQLLELEIELAIVSDDMRCRMKQRIDAVAEVDPSMQYCADTRKELEFHDHVCGNNPDHNSEVKKVNNCMVAMLKDFGGHEALSELIEIRKKLKGQIRETIKAIKHLHVQSQ